MLCDWMFEVGDEYHLKRETCHLSIRLVDLYLSRLACPVVRLQLLGAACLFLACKMEEITSPRVAHIAYACDNGFTTDEIIQMESRIL